MAVIAIIQGGVLFWQQKQIDAIKDDVALLWVPEIEYLDTAEEFFDSVAEATGMASTEVPSSNPVAQQPVIVS